MQWLCKWCLPGPVAELSVVLSKEEASKGAPCSRLSPSSLPDIRPRPHGCPLAGMACYLLPTPDHEIILRINSLYFCSLVCCPLELCVFYPLVCYDLNLADGLCNSPKQHLPTFSIMACADKLLERPE